MAESLEQSVGRLLRTQHLKIATAESCTGGLVASMITDVPGSSDYFVGGVIAYAYEAKTELLGISQDSLLKYGAVSAEIARAMASGARRRLDADIALGVTGILGPGGGTPEKPVGLVYIALSSREGETRREFVWSGNRLENKQASANAALELLRQYLEALERSAG